MSPHGHSPEALRVRIFVCGDSPSSVAALRNWRAIEADLGKLAVECNVVDVLEQQEAVIVADIVATPTTLLEAGDHSRRILGTLDDHEGVRDLIKHFARHLESG